MKNMSGMGVSSKFSMKKAPKMKTIPSSMKKNMDMSSEEKNTYDPRPSFSISEKVLPKINDMKVGDKCKMEMEAEMTGMQTQDWGNEKGQKTANFKITKISSPSITKESGMSSDMKM